MKHKRGRPKNSRAGCLLCKPNKMNGWPKHRKIGHTGFGQLRDEAHAVADLKNETCGAMRTISRTQ